MDFASLAPAYPELLLAVGAVVLLLIGVVINKERSLLVSYGAVVLLLAAAGVILFAPADGVLFNGVFIADSFARFMKVLVLGGSAFSLLLSLPRAQEQGVHKYEYSVLVVLASVGMLAMVSANDLMSLYVGLELQSLSLYVLAAIRRDDAKASEAGLKYFVLGALSSGILLYGASLLYGFTGTISFGGISAAMSGGLSTGALFGLVFVLVGLAFKISAVPFHMWTPDVYEGAPTPVTLFFASAPKVAAVALTARVAIEAFGTQADAWRQIVIFAALASIVVGALGAIGQTNIKRLLAYSSINNVGFILIGLAVASVAGVSAMLVYLAIYVVMTVGSFVAVLMMKNEAGEPVEGIADLAGLSRTRPALAWSLMALMFSLAGIPPLFGFW